MSPGQRLIKLNSQATSRLDDSMPSTGIPTLDRILGGNGYPDRSSILVMGPPGSGKESLCYWFTRSGLDSGDFCLFITRLSMHEITQDERVYGLRPDQRSPVWLSREGGQSKLDLQDLSGLATLIERYLNENDGLRIRIVLDILSSVLMLNSFEEVYKFADRLIEKVKSHDAILLATLEEGMHSTQMQVAMQQLFDGFIEFSFHKSGLKITPLVTIGKMRGRAPDQSFYEFSLGRDGVRLLNPNFKTVHDEIVEPQEAEEKYLELSSIRNFSVKDAGTVFDYLVRAFIEDYQTSRLAIEQSGWRTRLAISEATQVRRESFYGQGGKFGPVLKELLSSGLVETRFFPGQRGRGGEVIKMRIAYEKELVKRIVGRMTDGKTSGDGTS